MARTFIEFYSKHEKSVQLQRYATLGEKSKRYFLAYEYLRLGVGSQRYLARIFHSSKDRIRRGVKEVQEPGFSPDYNKQRIAGGGRKKRSKYS